MPRSPSPITLASAVAVALAVVLSVPLAARQITPTAQETEESQATDLLAVARLPALPDDATARLLRYTLAPGDPLGLPARGPALVYVERGTLGVAEGMGLSYVSSGPEGGDGTTVPSDRETLVGAETGVYAEDGNLGPLRNAGDDDLVLLVLLFVPPLDPDEYASESEEITAVAAGDAPGRPTPSPNP